jgi:Mg-chelatase subunit ChlD
MVSATRASLVALSMVGGLACAGIDDTVSPRPPTDAAVGTVFEGRKDAERPSCHNEGMIRIAQRAADILILFDRSGSMDAGFGSSSRYQSVAELLTNLVWSYQHRVHFGYLEMPGRSGCESQAVGCCASPPVVDVAPDNAQAIAEAIAQGGPVDGNTPTAAALLQAKIYFDSLDDGVENRYLLLVTDGVPNCTLSGLLSKGDSATAPACLDALAEVQGLVGAGVKVIVLSVGAESYTDSSVAGCLDVLAHAGGAAVSPGSPGYYSAEDPLQLRLSIEQIFGALARPSCDLGLPSLKDEKSIVVYLDDSAIPRDLPDGWSFDSALTPPRIQLTGAYCDRIRSFQVTSFVAYYDGWCEGPALP